MPYRCDVLTSWVIGDDGVRRSAAEVEYPAVWSDVTGQPDTNLLPAPNALVVRGERLSEAQMNALLADADYAVLWFEEVA